MIYQPKTTENLEELIQGLVPTPKHDKPWPWTDNNKLIKDED